MRGFMPYRQFLKQSAHLVIKPGPDALWSTGRSGPSGTDFLRPNIRYFLAGSEVPLCGADQRMSIPAICILKGQIRLVPLLFTVLRCGVLGVQPIAAADRGQIDVPVGRVALLLGIGLLAGINGWCRCCTCSLRADGWLSWRTTCVDADRLAGACSSSCI